MRIRIALLCWACIVLPPRAFAQANEPQFWPEFDFHWTLNKSVRLLFMTSATKDQDVENRKANFGAYADLKVPWLNPIRFLPIAQQDETRVHRLSVRLGYRYVRAADSVPPRVEHRFESTATFRWSLPAGLLLSDRNQFEYRLINDVFSWRYRLQLKLERDFKIAGAVMIPFISAEPFYDSNYGTVSRWRYETGFSFPIHRWTMQPYYAHQVAKHREPQSFNAAGLTVIFYAH